MDGGSTRGPRSAAVVFIFITVVLDMLALGVIVPVLPKLVVEFSGGDSAAGARAYGLFGSAWALMQFLFAPLLGALSDRLGRRPVILISLFGLGLDYIVMAVAPSLAWLFVGRVVSGITAATFSTASAYIADVTPPEKRAAGFGLLGAAFGLGFVLGPALGGILGHFDPRLPFWAAAGLTLANALYGVFVLPESLPPSRRAPFEWRRANPIGSLALLRSHPELLGLALAGFLYNVAHDVQPSTFVLYTDYRYGWDARTVGLTLAAVGVCSALVQAGLVGRVVARLGERRTLLLGLAFGVLGFMIYGFAPTSAVFWLGVPFATLWGLSGPALQGLMTRRVTPSEQGRLQGARASLMGIAGLIAPALFTQTFAVAIDPARSLHVPGAAFVLAAGLLLASLLIAAHVTAGHAEDVLPGGNVDAVSRSEV
jgi:DHA1 family tetracycline resistance protein-like MFS transporter